jgi:hypothetical protein
MRVRKEHRIQQQQPQNSDDSQNLKRYKMDIKSKFMLNLVKFFFFGLK